MQPDTGGGFDWAHALSAFGGAIVGALLTIAGWLYRAGGKEPTMRLDFQRSLDEAEKRVETKVEDMTGHFHEYFEGIRRQQDEIKLSVERDFVRKDDFREFREEYRDDMRDLKAMIERGHK